MKHIVKTGMHYLISSWRHYESPDATRKGNEEESFINFSWFDPSFYQSYYYSNTRLRVLFLHVFKKLIRLVLHTTFRQSVL
ncbi:MAG: hypothetical protein IPG99_14895 [Ignavibacteria bacterium]|nr:hypothetical protein [Ignavibacteria bacterium]